jgi:hypothetical protein
MGCIWILLTWSDVFYLLSTVLWCTILYYVGVLYHGRLDNNGECTPSLPSFVSSVTHRH